MKHAHAQVKKMAGMEDDDVAELGKMAIKGIVTVGTVGITAGLMGEIAGSFQKP
jgi:hypothetical protein